MNPPFKPGDIVVFNKWVPIYPYNTWVITLEGVSGYNSTRFDNGLKFKIQKCVKVDTFNFWNNNIYNAQSFILDEAQLFHNQLEKLIENS